VKGNPAAGRTGVVVSILEIPALQVIHKAILIVIIGVIWPPIVDDAITI